MNLKSSKVKILNKVQVTWQKKRDVLKSFGVIIVQEHNFFQMNIQLFIEQYDSTQIQMQSKNIITPSSLKSLSIGSSKTLWPCPVTPGPSLTGA